MLDKKTTTASSDMEPERGRGKKFEPHHIDEDKSLMDNSEFLAVVLVLTALVILFTILFVFIIRRQCLYRKRKRREHTCSCMPSEHYPSQLNNNAFPPEYSTREDQGRGRVLEVNENGHQPCHVHCSCYTVPYPYVAPGMPGQALPYRTSFHHFNGINRDQPTTGHIASAYDPSIPIVAPCSSSLNTQVANPVYEDSVSNGSICENDGNSNALLVGPLADIFSTRERSFTQTVCGKQIVSVTHRVDYEGDTLFLDNMGILLNVPKGAVKQGHSQIITLVLNWDLSDNPAMSKEQSLVSPVVFVGPHGLKLDKPCTLIFRHCSFDPRQIRVMRSETEFTSETSWQSVGDGDDNSVSCQLTSDECQLKIDTFTLYTCIQAPLGNVLGKKWLQLAVFACPLRKERNHHQIRVYFLNKTPCALQWAIQNEATFGGKLVCPEKAFLFDGGDFDMFAKTRYISDGWELVDPSNMDKITFLKIWHGHCPHISVCYKRRNHIENVSKNRNVAIEMSLHLFTYQNEHEDDGEKIVIQVFEDDRTPPVTNEHTCDRHHLEDIEIHVNNFGRNTKHSSMANVNAYGPNVDDRQNTLRSVTSYRDSNRSNELKHMNHENQSNKIKVVINNKPDDDPSDALIDIEANSKTREISHELRKELKLLLDPIKPLGTDWKDLAAKLGLDICIPKLESYESPTEVLLNCVEHRGLSLTQLQSLFRSIDREDCAKVTEKYIRTPSQNTSVKVREPVENDCSGYKLYNGDPRNRRKNFDATQTHDNTDNLFTRGENDSRNYAYTGKLLPRYRE